MVFGIGMQEIVLICAIALIVVGPKKLPELARALGKGYGEFRRAFDEMKRNVETDFQTDEIRRSLLDLPPPLPTVVPNPRPESLLTVQPAADAHSSHSPYPATMDAAPPPPEQPGSAADPSAGPPPGQPHA
jgi:Tat protein translocase TatB subunit